MKPRPCTCRREATASSATSDRHAGSRHQATARAGAMPGQRQLGKQQHVDRLLARLGDDVEMLPQIAADIAARGLDLGDADLQRCCPGRRRISWLCLSSRRAQEPDHGSCVQIRPGSVLEKGWRDVLDGLLVDVDARVQPRHRGVVELRRQRIEQRRQLRIRVERLACARPASAHRTGKSPCRP